MMGICPNCGSWFDEGDACGCCGGGGGYSYENKRDNSREVKIDAENRINRVRYIVNSETSYDDENLRDAMSRLYEINNMINDCLRQGNVSEEFSLKSLQIEIEEIKGKIETKRQRNARKRKSENAKKLEKNTFIEIQRYNVDFDADFLIVRLNRQNDGSIVAYQRDIPIGLVSYDFARKGDKYCLTADEYNDYHIAKII